MRFLYIGGSRTSIKHNIGYMSILPHEVDQQTVAYLQIQWRQNNNSI